MSKITVLGAGNGGQALAAHLAAKGNKVTLFEHPQFKKNIEYLIKNPTIQLKGYLELDAELNAITIDPKQAVKDAEFIFFVAPSFAQKDVLSLIAPFLETGQVLVILPGNFGSLVFSRWLEEQKLPKDILIAETDTIPYACRIVSPGEIEIWGMKDHISIASLPASRTPEVTDRLENIFPIPLKYSPNVLAIGLYNTNMILHCPTMLMNAGRIESEGGNFSFYREGMTESVCAVMEQMDKERIAVGKSLGIDLLSTADDMKSIYNIEGINLRETILNNSVYCSHGNDAPYTVSHRYLEEDVPFLLVPLSALGKKLGVETPLADSVIKLAGAANRTDYYSRGLNLRSLGLEDMDIQQIKDHIN